MARTASRAVPSVDAAAAAPRWPRRAGACLSPVVWIAGLVVTAFTFVVFLPVLRNGFVNWDDAENFLRNVQYRGLAWANLRWMFTTAHTGHYIPVTWLTLGMDYLLWGTDPRGYHLTAIFLHSLNAVLFYFVAIRLIDAALAPRTGALVLAAGASALLFAVHPLRVESVAWATERRDLMAGLFTLLTVLAYLAASRRGPPGRLHAGWYWSSVGFFLLALLSKSIVIGLPVVLLALDYFPLRRGPGEMGPATQWVRLLAEKAPYLLLSAAVSVLMLMIGVRQELLTALGSLSLTQRIALSSYGLAFYVWKTVMPWQLSPLYPLHYPVDLLAPKYLTAALASLVFTIGAVLTRRRWPAALVGWVTYLALLAPVLGIVHNGTQIAADRYTYVACLGWALLGGAGVAWSLEASRTGRAPAGLGRLVVVLAGVCVLSLAALTPLQIRVWRNSETLWRHALTLDPDNAFAHYHLGGALDHAGRVEDARREYERAVALAPVQLPNAKSVFHASLGLLLQRGGDTAGAERNYLAALRYSGDNVLALNNLGVIAALRGNDAVALDYFRRALDVIPGHASTCENLRALVARGRAPLAKLQACPPIARTRATSNGEQKQPERARSSRPLWSQPPNVGRKVSRD
jgi:tetratricopeptide (TPR) repeat protein